MPDDLVGGLLATAVAAPVLIICCGGGGVLLAGIVGAVGGWLSGLGWIVAATVVAGLALTGRTLRRRAGPADCCDSPTQSVGARNG